MAWNQFHSAHPQGVDPRTGRDRTACGLVQMADEPHFSGLSHLPPCDLCHCDAQSSAIYGRKRCELVSGHDVKDGHQAGLAPHVLTWFDDHDTVPAEPVGSRASRAGWN